jgi:hypothetical protein
MNIIELAKQANGEPAWHGGIDWTWDELQKFAALVVANIDPKSFMSWQEGYEAGKQNEREACAKLCNDEADDGTEGLWDVCCFSLAKKIMARGEA